MTHFKSEQFWFAKVSPRDLVKTQQSIYSSKALLFLEHVWTKTLRLIFMEDRVIHTGQFPSNTEILGPPNRVSV